MTISSVITCVDCGGPCYQISFVRPDEPVEEGDVVSYRCRDCHDRWDVVVSADDT